MVIEFNILTDSMNTCGSGAEPTYSDAMKAVEQHIESLDLKTENIIKVSLKQLNRPELNG